MNERKFELNELPYDQFEVLGLNKREVLNLNPKELTALLSGEKTEVMDFIVDRKQELKGKISLTRNEDNSLSLMLHPVRQEIKNDIGLNEKEIEKLKMGELINKNINGDRHLVQLDPETNEILRAKTKDINLPVEIKGHDREKLLQGRDVQLSSATADVNIRLDMTDPKGYKIEQELAQEQKMNLGKDNKRGKGSKTKLIIAASLLISPTIGIFFLTKELLERDKRKFDLTNRDIQKLLNGNKTEIKDLSQIEKDLKGKLSLSRNEDNSVSFNIHPVRQEIKNDIGLNEKEIEKLKIGEMVTKNINGEQHLVQLDPETKEVLKAKEEMIPSHIKEVELTPEQKELLKAGKEIQLMGEKETFSAKIDLNNISGISIDDDRSKLQLIAEKGIKGADELIEKNREKTISLLEKYELKPLLEQAKNYENIAQTKSVEDLKEYLKTEKGLPFKFKNDDDNLSINSIRQSPEGEILKIYYSDEKGNEYNMHGDKFIEKFQQGEILINSNTQNLLQEQAKLSAEKLNNEAEAKLMTQMSNMDKDLNLSVNNSEQKSNDLAKNLFEKEKAIEFDLVTPGVSDVVQTDANRAEKMNLEKSQTVGKEQKNTSSHKR